jgi:exopolysaccharide biosynthesis polyprenyl glycosylphosphotransferase
MSGSVEGTSGRSQPVAESEDMSRWTGPEVAELVRARKDRRRGAGRAASPRWLGVAESLGPGDAVARRTILTRVLVVADLLAAAGALVILGAVSGQSLHLEALLLLPATVAVGKVVGLYDRDHVVIRPSTLDEAPALFQLATLTALCGWLVGGVIADAPLHRGPVLAAWIGFFLLLAALRLVARRVARRVAPEERLVVIGDRESYDRIRSKLPPGNHHGVHLLGWLPLRGERSDSGALGTVSELPSLVGRHEVHRVVVTGSGDQREMLDIVRLMKLLGVRVTLLPLMLEVVGTSVEFEDLEGVRLMDVRPFGLSRSSRFVKRGLDVVGATVGLVLLAPLFALVAAAIKLSSRGPVFFRQPRVGRGGATFQMLKFRSMIDGADALKDELRHLNEAEGLFKIASDPRVTRVGRFLRRTSIDELPQLVNVLRGEMSLVGPRPLVRDDDEQVEGWHRQRLRLTPGMTGPWQVLGSSRIPLDEMVTMDYLYVANWSLWSDVKLLMRTVPVVLGARGQ